MATTRLPFAPLNASRLQNLVSLKNRQNAIPSTLTSPTKRKAPSYDADNDDRENLDPILFLSPKRSKCPEGSSKDTLAPLCKPQNFFLTRAPPSPNDFSSSSKPAASPPRRPILSARSPAAPRIDTTNTTPLSAPAGRSPTRKRIGILNRRRTTASLFTRLDPPQFSAASTATGLGFSIDAALSGTIPSYTPRSRPTDPASFSSIPTLHQPDAKPSWFFDIHEDTEEELATNLMEHSTCTLDISSDEESATRERDHRGKENVPPPDDVSQTRAASSSDVVMHREAGTEGMKSRARDSRRKRDQDEGKIEIDRAPLGDLAAEDFYAEGCDGSSSFIIPAEEAEQTEESSEPIEPTEQECVELEMENKLDIDALMQKDDFEIAPKAALLQPIEKAEAGFEVWESGSAKGEE